MMKAPPEFIQEMKAILNKYKVCIDVTDQYDGHDHYCGQNIEIRSLDFVNGKYPIYIDEMEEFAKAVNS